MITRKRFTPMAIFGITWFVIFLFPAFIQMNPTQPFYVFEHRLYLPLAGLLILVIELFGGNEMKLSSPVVRNGLLAVVTALLITTFFYERAYARAYPFFKRAIAYSPHSALALNNYAEVLLDEKRFPEAVEAYSKSFNLQRDPLTAGKVADIYMKDMNDAASAITWFKRTVEADSSMVPAMVSIGDAYLNSLHDTVQATQWYKKALVKDTNNTFALSAMGVINMKNGDTSGGRKMLLRSLRQNPANLTALKWLAISYFNEGKINEAVIYLNKADETNQDDAELQRDLMICYYKLNDLGNTQKFASLYSKGRNVIPPEIEKYLKGNSSR